MNAFVVALSALSATAFVLAWWMLDQNISVHVLHSTHVVYYLLDAHGAVLYIGQTEDLERRYEQHTEDDEQAAEPWRRRIRGVVVVRHCRSQRQARRVERRMIRAVTYAANKGLCPRLRNQTDTRPPAAIARPWVACWVVAYWFTGTLFPRVRWHRHNPTPLRGVAPRRRPADHWDQWSPGLDDDIIDAVIVNEPRHHVITLALPPPTEGSDQDDDDDVILDDDSPDDDGSVGAKVRDRKSVV